MKYLTMCNVPQYPNKVVIVVEKIFREDGKDPIPYAQPYLIPVSGVSGVNLKEGCEIDFLYNRYKKIDAVKLIDVK